MTDILSAIWNAWPLILSLGFLLLMLLGFWRGLSTKPRPDHDRAPERMHY